MFETLFAKLAGSWIGRKLKLEDKMDDSKSWYKSRTIWAGVVAVLIALYNSIGANLHALPAIPDWVFALLGAVGVYGRVTADTKIG
jgi:hypothetical protein